MPVPFVVITDYVTHSPTRERETLHGVADVVCMGAKSEDDLDERVEDASALIVYHTLSLTARTIDRLRQCRLIVRGGVGFDNVDLAAANRRGIPVANVPDYGTEEVADSAIGLMLALTRGIALLNTKLRADARDWTHGPAVPLRRLRGRTFGVLGLGRIGTAAALRAKALGMRVVFYDPYRPAGAEKSLGIDRAWSYEELLRQSFVLSVHCPLTAETDRMVNADALAQMPSGSYLVNTARGRVVDHRAVPDLIAAGQLAGAALDVLEQEPPDAHDPLLQAWRDPSHPAHERVIVNSHCAFYSEEGLEEIRAKSAEACRRALLGLPLFNIVNQPHSRA